MTEKYLHMPNEIFADIKKWLDEGIIKSPQHQEIIYSYYWLTLYIWRYAKYKDASYAQSEIKLAMRLSRNDARLDYIVKRGGVLDVAGYTCPEQKDYPISYTTNDNGTLEFTMLRELDEVKQKSLSSFLVRNSVIKKPLIHTFNKPSDSVIVQEKFHTISEKVFQMCMDDEMLGSSGLYLYGVIVHSVLDEAEMSNDYLVSATGWGLRKVIRFKLRLVETGIINGLMSSRAAKGEIKINQYLTDSGVRFSPEYTFEGLTGIGGNPLRYDFAIFHDNLEVAFLIEYDEDHHHKGYTADGTEDWTDNHFKKVAIHDARKNNYSKVNDIVLIRIPEWNYDHIEIILDSVIGNVRTN